MPAKPKIDTLSPPGAAPQRPPKKPMPAEPAEATRAALVGAGLHLFGHKGFAAASTREIAARAGANVAAIAYHFGSKDGLRLACAEEVAARIGRVLGDLEAAPQPVTPDAARARLHVGLSAIAGYLAAAPEAADLAAFLLREITEEGDVLDRLYETTVGPRHRQLCVLWGLATGTDPEAADTRLSVFAMIGQVVYFRIGRPVVLRRMGGDGLDPEALTRILIRNLDAALDAAIGEVSR